MRWTSARTRSGSCVPTWSWPVAAVRAISMCRHARPAAPRRGAFALCNDDARPIERHCPRFSGRRLTTSKRPEIPAKTRFLEQVCSKAEVRKFRQFRADSGNGSRVAAQWKGRWPATGGGPRRPQWRLVAAWRLWARGAPAVPATTCWCRSSVLASGLGRVPLPR